MSWQSAFRVLTTMRSLSEYELERWFDDLGRFKAPVFALYGDELGEAYDTVVTATRRRANGLSDEFVRCAAIEALDLHYQQIIVGIYGERWNETPEELGFPPVSEVIAKQEEFRRAGDVDLLAGKKAADWAYDQWRASRH